MTFNPSDNSWDDQVANTGGNTLPDGEHVVFIADAILSEAKTGTKSIEVEYQCHDPRSEFKGKGLKWQRFWLSDASLPRLVKFCRAAGITKAFALTDEKAVQDAFLDAQVRIVVRTKVEKYQGEDKSKTEAAFFNPLKDTDKAALVAEYGETMLPPMAGGDESDLPI